MPLFPSDFKKFKHVKSDDKTTTLQHPSGHMITIVHAALKEPMRTQLQALSNISKEDAMKDQVTDEPKKMADGGLADADRSGVLGTQRKVNQEMTETHHVQAASAPAYTDGKDVRTPDQKAKAAYYERTGGLQGYENKACGGEVKMYADSDEPVSQDDSAPVAAPVESPPSSTPAPAQDSPDLASHLGELVSKYGVNPIVNAVKGIAQVGGQATHDALQASGRFTQGLEKGVGMNVAPAQVPPETTAPVQSAPSESAPDATAPAAPLAPTPAQQMMQGQQDAQSTFGQGLQQKENALSSEALHRGQLGVDQAAALKKAADAETDAKIAYQIHFNDLNAERENLQHDIRTGQIDPEKYWSGDKSGNGSHSKLASAIGIILAGFNPTNNPNAAINLLKFQMEQNLQAQQKNLDSKQNLLAANLRQFGNLREATDMTRIMQSDIIQNQLQQAAAQASSPLAKDAANNAIGQLKMENAQRFATFANMRAITDLARNGGNPDSVGQMISATRFTNPEMAKDMEARYVPKVGLATIPVPGDVREKMIANQNTVESIKDLQQFVKTHTTLVPGTADYNTGAQKALALQAAVREGKLGTVYKEGEQPLLDKFVSSNPAGALKQLQTVPQLNELFKSTERANNILKSNYGLPVQAPAPEIKVINGVRYMRGPDGKAVKVK